MNKSIIINVLPRSSYDDCHIKGSINVPLDDLEDYVAEFDKNQEIIVHCAKYDCPISRKAFRLLKMLGFGNVKAYEGGIVEWFQLGYPVEGPCKQETLKVTNKLLEPEQGIESISAQELKKKL